MRILRREPCLPRLRTLIPEFLPSPDPTSTPQLAQVTLSVMNPLLLLLEILPCL